MRRGPRDPVRVGVVGLGYWGPNLARNLQERPEAELAGLCDLSTERLDRLGRRYPAATLYPRLELMLADPSIEAITVATPVSTHHAIASTALRAGKHVFVEKPLAASTAEAADLIRLAKRKRHVLMPGHTFLYSPPVTMIGELIRSGELGEIYFISTSRVNLGLHQADASVAWDLGPHDFSILRYWLGETPSHASALTRSCIFPGVPDVAFISLEFPSGTIAHVELSWLAPSKLRRTAIVGSRKMVVYDDTSNEPVRVFDSGAVPDDPETFGEYRLTYRTGDIVSPHLDAAEPLGLELQDFCSAIRHGTVPVSSSEIGLEVVRMVEAVDRSLTSYGARIELAEPLERLTSSRRPRSKSLA
ncbi:MAG TPA: Gfo/Idh/MocA family oxidoreductase [Gaiellaceae bacterium]|jgi:predicted dehydrogenase|nr:Gfo/Idh/MocA family oxidoreductase [Gaiellaceae bacterium]